MSIFSRLFGKVDPPKPEAEVYQGFQIFPEPYSDAGGYRVAARIEKEIGGELKIYQLVRADTSNDLDTATSLAVLKAKQLIDQMGDQLF